MKAASNEKLEDERLLVEASQEDRARFAEIYEENFARVYAYFARRVTTREEAQDLTAEVFHQALASLGNFEWQGRPFVSWLFGIAGNVLAQHWQRAAKRAEVAADDLAGLELAGSDHSAERRAMLFELVDALPAEQRHVVVRRFVDQRSLREIAREMDRSEGAIKQLQLRALRNLREQMRSGS
ncbi:MAG: sigma-70 family RNA polymerase sigma factor [Acidobacteria bacterium]|nr:sigma-70 family RNA polymerase sigma factor [Acidobacteriota bacterium]